MKAPAFDYVRAESVDHASRLLAEHGEGARIIAGGQSLVPALNLRLQTPSLLIDIGRLTDLRTVNVVEGGLRVGALVRHAELLTSPLIAQHCPLLRDAARYVAHPAIRNRGTIGGSLAHADPASEQPACMLALDATIVVRSASGERRIAACDFFRGIFETALRPDEVLTAIETPAPVPGQRAAIIELSRRSGDFAMAGLAACAVASRHDGLLDALHLAYFGIGDRPTLAAGAAACLVGRPIDAQALAEARGRLSDDLQPHDDLQATRGVRLHFAGVLLGRVLTELVPGLDIRQKLSA